MARKNAYHDVVKSALEKDGWTLTHEPLRLVVDEVGCVTHANGRFQEMWQVSEDVIASRDDDKLIVTVLDQLIDPEAFVGRVLELYRSEDTGEDLLHFKDGRIIKRYSRPLDRGGFSRGRVWSFEDITKRKRAEAALKESEVKFRSLVESSQTVPFSFDLIIGRYTYIGSQVEKWLGYPAASWTDLDSWSKRIYSEDQERVVATRVSDTSAGQDHVLEYRMMTADGRTVWVREFISVLLGWVVRGSCTVLCSISPNR